MDRFARLSVVLGLAAVSLTAGAEVNLWISYYAGGMAKYGAGAYGDAETLVKQALDESTVDHRRAFAWDAAGRAYTSTGKYAEAEQALMTALCLKEDNLGERSRTVPETLNNLGDLQYVAGDMEKAEAYYRRALDIHVTDQLNVEACRSLNGMALIHNARGEYAEAEALLKDAIDRHQRASRRDHPYTASALTNLGILYMRLGRTDEAGPQFARAQYIQDKVLRADHPDAALRLHAQAELWIQTGDLDAARAARAQADAIDAGFAAANIGDDTPAS